MTDKDVKLVSTEELAEMDAHSVSEPDLRIVCFRC